MQAERVPPLIDDLVSGCYPALVRLCLSILDDGTLDAADEAEDAAQEAIILAARHLEGYRGDASPKTWLFRIAINTCRMRLRKRKARRGLQKALEGLARVFRPASLQERVERRERDRELWQAVDELDERHRVALLLRYVHELPVAEIAQVLEISEGTVHSRLHYARARLAQQLSRRVGVEEEAAWR